MPIFKSFLDKRFIEIEKTKSICFFNKFLARILNMEKLIILKKKNKIKFSLWKIYISDHSGMIELFSESSPEIRKGDIVEIYEIKVFYYRGKIKIFGSIKEFKTAFKVSKQFLFYNMKKNYSLFNNKKNFFFFD
jgi:hypothetical protein